MRSTFDFGAALTYMFESADWTRKYLIALVVAVGTFLIVPLFLYQGYLVELIRRVMRADADPLPEWEGRWGDYLRQGFTAFIGQAIYGLPLAFFCACALIPYIASIDPETGTMSDGMALLFCLSLIVYFIAALIVGYFGQAATINYARVGTLAAFFDLREVFALARSRPYLKGFFTSYLAIFVSGLVPFIATPWGMFASGHALGQAARAHFGSELAAGEAAARLPYPDI